MACIGDRERLLLVEELHLRGGVRRLALPFHSLHFKFTMKQAKSFRKVSGKTPSRPRSQTVVQNFTPLDKNASALPCFPPREVLDGPMAGSHKRAGQLTLTSPLSFPPGGVQQPMTNCDSEGMNSSGEAGFHCSREYSNKNGLHFTGNQNKSEMTDPTPSKDSGERLHTLDTPTG